MKVAISIPDPIFAKAEVLAKRAKLSRSRLYARAVEEYLDKHAPDRITELANAAADAMSEADLRDAEQARRTTYRTVLQQTEW